MHISEDCKAHFIINLCVGLSLLNAAPSLLASPDHALVYTLKASVVKVHTITQQGGQGVGTGVVVAPDIVATNCHVLAHAQGVSISKLGDSISPVSMQADWRHDICLLRFQYLNLPAVTLSSAQTLQYGQEVFFIGFPGGPPKPQTSAGKIRALYPYENSMIVRSDAAFIMGASGSPLFNNAGELIALSTFKSPGRQAYFYSIPADWIPPLMHTQAQTDTQTKISAFWDQPTTEQPYLMQVVQPYQSSDWPALQQIAEHWIMQEPNTAEAYFYLASAHHGQGRLTQAQQAYLQCVKRQPRHADAWSGLALLARQSQQAELENHAQQQVKQLDADAYAALLQQLQALQ